MRIWKIVKENQWRITRVANLLALIGLWVALILYIYLICHDRTHFNNR